MANTVASKARLGHNRHERHEQAVILAYRGNRHKAGLSAPLPHGSRPGRLLRWFATLLLLFNVLAGGVLPATANAEKTSFSDFAGAVVVCTAAGMVVFDHDAQPTDSAGKHYVCALCLPLIHMGVVMSTPSAVPAPPLPVPQALVQPDSRRPAEGVRLAGGIAPRAPPALV